MPGPEHVNSAADSLGTTSGREERADEAVLRQRQLRNTDLIIALMGGVLLLGGRDLRVWCVSTVA